MLIPVKDKVLIEPYIEKDKSEIKRADSEKEDKKLRPEKGKIVAVGNEYDGNLKKGQIVFFSKYEVEWLEIGVKEYVVANPDNVLLIEK